MTKASESKLSPDQTQGDQSNAILGVMGAVTQLMGTVSAAEVKLEQRYADADARRSRIVMGAVEHIPSLVRTREQMKAAKKARHHGRKRVSFFHYSYYDVAFKYFVEQVMDCEWVPVPPRTRRTMELGARYSVDTVCAPFKHILGDYIEALEAGADVLVQFGGPCRLGYYGEMHEAILHDLGYTFRMLNFSELADSSVKEYVDVVRQINPDVSVRKAIRRLLSVARMIEDLDNAYDYYLAHAGLEVEPGRFAAAWDRYIRQMGEAVDDRDIAAAQMAVLEEMQAIPLRDDPHHIRVGLVGEFFTAVGQVSNLNTERKLIDQGVELHRSINLTNRYLRYNEPNLRAGVREYVTYDMGPTSTLTIAAAKKYAEQGFDGLVHIKSSGCTPEIDCMPVLQRISQDYRIPVLFLSFDSQTSDAGLDTRVEAFYDMLKMKKDGRLS